jgi:hypothetical protein
MTVRRAVLPVALALLAWHGLGCGSTGQPEERLGAKRGAVTLGASDATDTAVVALLEDQQVVCTATVVAPQVVLTAAHCLYSGGPLALPDVSLGETPDQAGVRVPTVREWLHPLFDPVTHANDVAVLLTATRLPVATLPILETLPADAEGSDVTVVGFGKTAVTSAATPSRSEGTSRISALAPTTLTLRGDPSLPCEGDSGGPVLLSVSGVPTVAGVVSYGDDACASFAVATRVDVYATTFLDSFASQGGIATGGRCFFDGNCSEGVCVSPSDAPLVTYCDGPCGAGCASPMQCVTAASGSRCRYPLPSPGALGTTCASSVDCDSALCARASVAALPVCATPCFSDDPSTCPTGYSCEPNPDIPSASACFVDPPAHVVGGGCVQTSATPDAPSCMAVALLILIARRWKRERAGAPHAEQQSRCHGGVGVRCVRVGMRERRRVRYDTVGSPRR